MHLDRAEEKVKKKKAKKDIKSKLSFALDDEDEEQQQDDSNRAKKRRKENGHETPVNKTTLKNPNVDTSFLPDRNREEEERRIREQLRQEWLKKQEEMKKEDVEITYSYWDGQGHRKSVKVGLLLLPLLTCACLC